MHNWGAHIFEDGASAEIGYEKECFIKLFLRRSNSQVAFIKHFVIGSETR